MSLNDNEYEHVQRLAVEEATALTTDLRPDRDDDSGWDKFHDTLFGRVLTDVDNSHYSYLDARDISVVCDEVENDIRHGDILGL
jgi:hypothetical protein